MLFFALNGSAMLGRRVAAAGGFGVALHEEREFAGGEHKARPLLSVRGKDVYVLHGLHGGYGGHGTSANDRLLRLLFFCATCRENGAARVTAIAPYLAYSRKDRQTKQRDPVTTRYVAQLFEAVGVDRVITLDVHNLSAFQNAFRCQSVHLSMCDFFATDILARAGEHPLVVASPDPGGVKRAQLLRETVAKQVEVDFAMMEKRRSGGVVSGTELTGQVAGRAVHVIDDMVCGGGTLIRAAQAARDHKAAQVHGLVTHGLMDADALQGLLEPGLFDSLTLSDSAAPFAPRDWPDDPRLRVIGCAPVIASAIRALHEGRSVSDRPLPHVTLVDGGQ